MSRGKTVSQESWAGVAATIASTTIAVRPQMSRGAELASDQAPVPSAFVARTCTSTSKMVAAVKAVMVAVKPVPVWDTSFHDPLSPTLYRTS